MYISNVLIKNYKNFKELSVSTQKVTAVIGNNNAGKTNFLEAITLPLFADEINSRPKKLNWSDINQETRNNYYDFILEKKEDIVLGSIDLEKFNGIVPEVKVILEFEYEIVEFYAIKELLSEIDPEIDIEDRLPTAALEYRFFCKNTNELLVHVKEVLERVSLDIDNLDIIELNKFKQNLLPIEFFEYSILIPNKETSASYDLLKNLTYNFISTDRDNFSSNNSKLGSKSLVKLLNNKLNTENKVIIEKEYNLFFETIKNLSDMDNVLNWQENTDISNAQSFFEKITILPNMPPMNSLLNSVMLGYDEQHLSSQGLGYRNLILLLVMINSLLNYLETFYSLLVIEEPEAHISHSNHQLLKSYLSSVSKSKESVQILYSTHDVNFINKLDLNSLVLFYDGNAISLKEELNKREKDYLSRNPNLDLFKLFYSTKCILVEGITEEIFLKTYLHNLENTINDIEVISFHKGFTNIIDIWLKLYEGSNNKLGIIRDFDDEPNARDNHHKYNSYDNICVDTTDYYTLEDEIVNANENFSLLNTYFHNEFNWDKFETADQLSEFWKKQKADTMTKFSRDLSTDKLKGFTLPRHIVTVLEFMDIDVTGGQSED